MSFERIFESRTSRIVMIGLFMALLELIREKLVGAEQQETSTSIYLRPLTEKNAEQAVQEAILTLTESADDQSAQAQKQKKPPIPIAELPSEKKPKLSSQELEKQEIKSAEGNKQENTNSGLT